jgi:Zn-dependent protease with chaperone function
VVLELISVTLVSAAGWLISLSSPHSAARRHLILTSALGACLLLPMALIVRAGTSSTLLTFETKVRRNTIAPIRTPPSASVIAQRASLIDHASASEAAARTPHAEDVTARNDKETFRSLPTISDFSATAIGRPEQISPQNPTALPRRTWQTSAARWGRTVYAVVAATLLIRLLFGLASVLRLKRLAGAIDSFANGIPVLEADIAIPLAIGFGKPVIVLPRGFAATVTPNELRDVLAHEAEHLRRRDHWTILLQRLIATAYWPVVTVHLLNRALDRAREELCDNAAIRERDPASYGHTLLVVAQQVGVRNESLSQWATSVIGQGELERREAGLLDRRRDRRTRISRSVRWTTTATLLLLCGLAGTTRVVAVADGTQQSKSTPAEPAKAPAAPKAMLEWTGIPKVSLDNPTLHRGIVLGPDGHPLPGASIYAASTIELLELSKADKVSVKDLGPVRAVTDAQGRFEFDAQDLSWVTPAGVRKRWETLLVAARDGVVSGWIETYGDDRSFRSHWNPFPGKDVAIRTRPPVTLAGALSLEGGTPLANARVRLTALFAPFEYDLDRHIPREEKKEIGLFSGINYAERLHRPWLLPGLKTETTTDNDGRFELPSLPEVACPPKIGPPEMGVSG